jgi:hypothetical protein
VRRNPNLFKLLNHVVIENLVENLIKVQVRRVRVLRDLDRPTSSIGYQHRMPR